MKRISATTLAISLIATPVMAQSMQITRAPDRGGTLRPLTAPNSPTRPAAACVLASGDCGFTTTTPCIEDNGATDAEAAEPDSAAGSILKLNGSEAPCSSAAT